MSSHTSSSAGGSRWQVEWGLLVGLLAVLTYGSIILYSASGQDLHLVMRRGVQTLLGLLTMLVLAQIPPRIYEFWAPYLYVTCLLLLLLVGQVGHTAKGAQRWLDLGICRFQPSELAKMAVPLMVASFVSRNPCPPTVKIGLIALLLILVPTLLVAMQPDLGTAILIAISGLLILFLAGIQWQIIAAISALSALLIPVYWFFLMHDYQRGRILTLLNPRSDPLGRGYHIIQSKIAIGSGGFLGKGWLHGTQSQLEFLPERHTDFIFAVLAEELGLAGVVLLVLLYLCVTMRGLILAVRGQTVFARLLIGSYTLLFQCYVLVNIAMVSGLLPVVGVPLPLVSYGGSSLLIIMSCFGIISSLATHRNLLSKPI